MTFTEAITTCFRKYATFKGRARRPEYWWFMLFLFLGHLVAGVLDAVLFGAASVDVSSGDGTLRVGAENNGPVGAIFGLATLLPCLAAGWRRMHDTGRSGLYLFYPLIVMIGIGLFASLTGALGGVLPGEDGTITPLQGLAGILLAAAGVVFLISPFLVVWWLTRPTQRGANDYGPFPREVLT